MPGEANTAWTDAGNEYKHFIEVTLLGLLDATFEPIDVREHYERIKADVAEFKSITVFTEESCLSQKAVGDLLKRVEAIEIGRRLSIGKVQSTSVSLSLPPLSFLLSPESVVKC